MNSYEYSQILKETILANGQGCLIIAALLLGVAIVDWIIDKTLLADEHGDSRKYRKRTKRILLWAAIIVAIEVAVYAEKCLPALKDIKENSYVCVHGEYYMYNYNYRADRDGDIYVTLDSGEIIGMYLPKRLKLPRIDEERFPSGKYTGTVWYAENSHIILEFIPDESTDGN